MEYALKKMRSGRTLGPDSIPIEIWRSLGEEGLHWLTKVFNRIIMTRKMPEDWRRSILVPIYKNKGDIQSCNNHRGIKLISHTMKLWKMVIEHHLRRITSVKEKQFVFMPSRSTMKAIYLLKRLVEKYRVDLEKTYDRVSRDII